MATDDLFTDDFWYDDDGFVGYVETTVNPGNAVRMMYSFRHLYQFLVVSRFKHDFTSLRALASCSGSVLLCFIATSFALFRDAWPKV